MDFPFTTDGCSGGMSATWRRVFRRPPPWEGCCTRHDVAYWAGGTRLEKLGADLGLLYSVTVSNLWCSPLLFIIAFGMFVAVTIGGGPRWRTGYRWAYGWRFERGRGYAPLSAPDRAARDNQLASYSLWPAVKA